MLLMTAMMCILPACDLFGVGSSSGDTSGSNTSNSESQKNEVSDIENPVYNNEQEGEIVKEKKADEKDFYGKWEASSDRAEYLYGNLNFTIRPDHTWKANISEEDFSGTWDYNGTGITLSSDLVNCELFYAQDGSLMFRDLDSPDILLVLTKD